MTEAPAADRTAQIERLRRLFRLFGATQCRGLSPVYEALSEGVAGDDELLGLMLGTPADQRRPSLLFAAVNFLLAQDPDAELAAYYPIYGGRRAIDARLLPVFGAFCDRHDEVLKPILRLKSTQTNEIRRCVALHLGLDHVHRRWPGPLGLVEVGASAGLNLLFDRYRYRLNDHEIGAAGSSPVLISSKVRGNALAGNLLAAPPPITSRLGIDQKPVDLADPDARAWLEAFIWPEQVEDLAALRGAVELALDAKVVTMARGDATADTARLLAGLPGGEPVVVFTASLLSYLTADARAAFLAQLDEAAARRPVAWVFAEGPALLAGAGLDIAALAGSPLGRDTVHYAVGASLRGPAPLDDRLLALADPYLRWLAPARSANDDFQWALADA